MTTNESSARRDFDVRSLPTFSPDPALRERILAAHARQTRRQRARRWLGGGSLAAAAVLATLLIGRHQAPSSLASHAKPPRSAQDESRDLEMQWQRAAGRHARAAVPRLRAIDAQLQSAYDRGADDSELSVLWARRNLALRSLIDASGTGIVATDDNGATRI